MSPARARLLVHPVNAYLQALRQLRRREDIFGVKRIRRVHLHQLCTAGPKLLILKIKKLTSRSLIGVSLAGGHRA